MYKRDERSRVITIPPDVYLSLGARAREEKLAYISPPSEDGGSRAVSDLALVARYRSEDARVKNKRGSGGPRGERMDGRASRGQGLPLGGREGGEGQGGRNTGESGMMLHAILFPGGGSPS